MFSVRDILTGVFLVLIAVSTGAVWFLADTYSKRNTDLLAAQIQRELSGRISERIQALLSTPHSLNAMGESVIRGGQLYFTEPESANRVFHGVLSTYPHINALFFGAADGTMLGARWSPAGDALDVMEASARTGGAINYYRADSNGLPKELVESAPDYDPRTRSWYSDAVRAGGAIWSPIYLDFATRALVMTAACPVYDSNAELLGVMGCGIQFKQIDHFLESLDIGKGGTAYLMESDGTLVSTSTENASYRLEPGKPERIDAREFADPVISESAMQIRARLNTPDAIHGAGTVHLALASGATYGSVFRIADNYGLNWFGVVVVPESNYTAAVKERGRVAFGVFLAVMLVALVAGLVSARTLTSPLALLAAAARNIAKDVWDAPLETGRQDEFGEVARAFDHMRGQLYARIEDLQATRNALRESEEHYARALEAARVVAWSWTVSEDEIRWTEQGTPMLGPAPGEHRVHVRDYLQRVHPEDRGFVARSANAAIEEMQDYNLEYRIQLADGGTQWVASRGKVFQGPGGKPAGMAGVILDISDRKRLEAQLLEAQKMEAVGRLAGGVAHDFNNLLQAILGFADMARDAAGPESPAQEELEEVIRAAERATALVSQLLAFSRRQLLKLEHIALDDVVSDMGKMLARLIDESIELRAVPDATGAIIYADRGQVEQILINLCVNARDAMPNGGVLEIIVSTVELTPADCIKLPSARPGHFHRLRVRDSGHGMDAKTIKLMFDPFFTTKEVGKGTGLGLATVYGIVEQHQGFLDVSSEAGEGTTIDVYFQAEDSDAEQSEKPAPAVLGVASGTILLAEDNDAVRLLARRILERTGYNVIEAADGDAAIAAFDGHRDEIDAAFLDVVMPKKNGRLVLEYLRKESPNLPVMFASGYAEGEVHTNFVLEEGLVLVQKPYNAKKLLAALQSVLNPNGSTGQ